ncbi:MAG: hypothetical protein BGO67_05390 [Alphaproteobacteria bacterium 41-28]|nr:MAG: hypothetical protein BGO67_05390 [Alphaproteobacteria bacterium 41-28]
MNLGHTQYALYPTLLFAILILNSNPPEIPMAIQFARCEYVSRSKGGNACRKASYNQRTEIRCERTGELFSFQDRGGDVHHEILLPEGADLRFKSSSILWNEAERCERRKDSQVAKEFVLALPDDKQVTLEDRIELTRRFAETHFVEKGLAVQLDVHEPDEHEKNWHAHLLVTTRRFTEEGLGFEKAKARDLDPTIRKGCVIEADIWGELWRDLQNAYFEEKSYDLRVDPVGVLSQEHLGPVRMRHHMNEAIARSQLLQKANEQLAQDPGSVLEALTRNKAVFSEKDLDIFLKKHVPHEAREQVCERVLTHPTLLSLYDKETGKKTVYFTTKEVRAEEEKLLRFADKIAKKPTPILSPEAIAKGMEGRALSEEQHKAYDLCAQSGQNLSLIQGRAGVGKSYVLDAIRMAHENEGYWVLGLAPTHKVASDLRESGFKDAKTCHGFLFAFRNNKENLDPKTLVIVDEAGMLGTTLSVELFHAIKTSGAKLILVGDDRQLSSVERGGVFGLLAERYESVELKDVRRQTINWQKTVSEDLSKGEVKSAVHLLQENKAIHWNIIKEEALTELLKTWAEDNAKKPDETRLILAQRNVDVDALNQGAREILRQQGKLGGVELSCMTQRGKEVFAEEDRVQLTRTDKDKGLRNGTFGVIEHIDMKTKILTLRLDNKEKVTVDPHTYDGLRHGYASTVYKAQGSTLDHVYVLHSQIINKLVNYVALTRQTKSLSLYVSKDETPSEGHLIRQMSREDGNKASLVFDTQKDIEKKNEDKTLITQIKHGVETITTKVKDVFHNNEKFYQFENPLTTNKVEATLHSHQKQEQISSALQAAYKEMAHPAFANATVIRRAFAKGLKVHGEEKAIAYWDNKKEGPLRLYQQNLGKVETELHSPLLNRLTDHWKDQARELAKQEPMRVLGLLQKLKEDELNKREQVASDNRKLSEKVNLPQKQEIKQNPMEETYLRFKALHDVFKDISEVPPSFKEEFKHLAQELIQDKNFMESLKLLDANKAKIIQRIAQEQERSKDLGRGGLSL